MGDNHIANRARLNSAVQNLTRPSQPDPDALHDVLDALGAVAAGMTGVKSVKVVLIAKESEVNLIQGSLHA